MFSAFDENRDEHIDFKELCCGVSAACRGPNVERIKCEYWLDVILNRNLIVQLIPVCFKIFDIDQDGVLNYAEIDHLTDILLFVAKENAQSSEGFSKQAVLNDIVNFGKKNNEAFSDSVETFQLKQEDFLMWTVENSMNLIQPFLDLTFEVCHIVFGLRPQCKHLENDIGEWLTSEDIERYWLLIFQWKDGFNVRKSVDIVSDNFGI